MKTAATSRSPPRRSVTGSATCTSERTTGATSGPGTREFDAFFGALADIVNRGPRTFESFSSAVLASGCQTTWPSGPGSGRRLRPGRQGPRVHDGRTYPGPRCCGPVTEPGVNPGPAGLADPGGSGGGARPRATDGRSWAWSGPRAPARGPWPSSCWPSLRVRHEDEWVAHVPMDGSHLADAQLRRFGSRGWSSGTSGSARCRPPRGTGSSPSTSPTPC